MALPQTVPYLGWTWDDVVFLVLAGVLIGSSLMVVLSRNIIRSGLFMILGFLGLAGFYALMGATLVAAAQVLVYVGAISVLILFAVMLTQSKSGPASLVFHHQAWAAGLASVILGLLLIMSVVFTTWPLAAPEPIAQSARDVATLLFRDYVLAFEVISLLLLSAVIGGIYLARRDAIPDPSDPVTRSEGTTPSPSSGARQAEER
jgi:NADH:ubiquinone oxidoreductase subunit 6 (subunit J)